MTTTYLERGCIELDKKKHELKILTMSHLDVANKFKLIMNLADLVKSKPFFSVQFCFEFLTLLKTDFIDLTVPKDERQFDGSNWKEIIEENIELTT